MKTFFMLPLALAGASLLQSQLAFAQEINEEHVLVTIPVHRQANQNALPVTAVSGEELRDKSAATLGETLTSFAGINNASFGPSVGRPVIRGQQGARVTILQNSTSVADVSTVSPDHAVASEAILAESIEVLRGPSTLLYGGGAIGGVVNVLDKRIPQEQQTTAGQMEIRHASVNDESTVVGKLTTGVDNFTFYIDGLKRRSNNMEIPGFATRETEHEEHEDHDESEEHDEELENSYGFIENSSSDTESFTLGTSYILSNGYIGVAVNHLESDYGIPPGAHAHDEHDEEEEHEEEGAEEEHDEHGEEHIRIDLKRTRYDARGDWHELTSAIEHLRWFFTYTDYEHTEASDEAPEPGETAHTTTYKKRSSENRFELVHRETMGWHGAVGLQVGHETFSAEGSETFIPPVSENTVGLFALEDYHSNFGLYQVGARVDYDTLDLDTELSGSAANLETENDFTNVSFALSGLWLLSTSWNLGLALSSAERAPTVEELYSNLENVPGSYVVHGATQAIEVGDAQLDSERSHNADVSLSLNRANSEGFLTLFYNDFADYIYLQHSEESQDEWEIYHYAQTDARFYGAEVEFKHYWQKHDVKVFADVIRGTLASGEDIPRMPPARVGAEWGVQFAKFSGRISVLHAFEQDRPGEDEAPSEAYTRLDLALEYGLDESANNLVFVKLKNASDEEIRESTSFLRDVAPAAGRSVEAGLRLSF